MICQFLNADRAFVTVGVFGSLHHGSLMQRVDSKGQQILFGHLDSLLKGTAVGQFQPEGVNTVSDDIPAVTVVVREGCGRYPKELPRSKRLEEDSESIVPAGEVGTSRRRSLRSHDVHWRNELTLTIRIVDSETIAELKSQNSRPYFDYPGKMPLFC
jgi:hypothetical protein